MSQAITPQILVWAYQRGIFPMAESRQDDEIAWYSPDPRTIMPLERFHISRSLAKRIKSGAFCITRDQAFSQVIRSCALPRAYEGDTWINDEIIEAFIKLHELGAAHSVEAWAEDDQLVGGLYGVSLGGAFFGESMFSRRTDASKVCLAHLVDHLREQGYVLLDVQFSNPHLEQFGVEQISREDYLARLDDAIQLDVGFG